MAKILCPSAATQRAESTVPPCELRWVVLMTGYSPSRDFSRTPSLARLTVVNRQFHQELSSLASTLVARPLNHAPENRVLVFQKLLCVDERGHRAIEPVGPTE
jgi:hypothetical protein